MTKPSLLEFEWATRVDGLEKEWDDCFYHQQAMQSFALQRALEASELPETNFYHLVARDEKGPAMVIPCCTVRLDLLVVAHTWLYRVVAGIRKVFPKFLYARLFIVGSAMSTCGSNIGIKDMADETRWSKPKIRAIFDEVIKKAKSLGIAFVIIKEPDAPVVEFLSPGLKGKFFFPESLPTTYLHVPKGGYMKAIRTRYRNKMKNRRAVAAEHGLYWVVEKSAEGLLDRMFELHSQIMDHAMIVFERLNRKFFDKAQEFIEKDPAKDTFYTLGFQKLPDGGKKLVCCEFVMIEGDTLYPLYTGFDYSIKKEADIYFNAFYALIDEAEKRGLSRIHLGQTAYEAKAELGCVTEKLYIGFHHTNPILHGIIWLFKGIFFETTKVPLREVFNTAEGRE